jgi:hypothetical protein
MKWKIVRAFDQPTGRDRMIEPCVKTTVQDCLGRFRRRFFVVSSSFRRCIALFQYCILLTYTIFFRRLLPCRSSLSDLFFHPEWTIDRWNWTINRDHRKISITIQTIRQLQVVRSFVRNDITQVSMRARKNCLVLHVIHSFLPFSAAWHLGTLAC